MKGSILKCAKNLILENYGKPVWDNAMKHAGLDPDMLVRSTADIDDNEILKLFDSVCKELKISHKQLSEAFGEYWVTKFAFNIYGAYYLGVKTSKDFFLKLDDIHYRVTKNIENAKPPRFEYQWKGDKSLIINYISKRNLIDLFIGLAKGVGKHFNENIMVEKLSETQAKITFV